MCNVLHTIFNYCTFLLNSCTFVTQDKLSVLLCNKEKGKNVKIVINTDKLSSFTMCKKQNRKRCVQEEKR